MSSTLIPPPEELPFDEEDVRYFSEPAPPPDDVVEEEPFDIELDPGTARWLDDVVMRCLIFLEELCDIRLFPYQQETAYRMFESLILGDGEEITVLQARQSGKSESVSDVFATAMVIFPRLAVAFPDTSRSRSSARVCSSACSLRPRTRPTRLRTHRHPAHVGAGTKLMLDPEIDDETGKAGSRR